MALYLGSQKVCPIIKSGTTPTGTLNITANGVYDVTNYASVNVSVSGGSSELYEYTKGSWEHTPSLNAPSEVYFYTLSPKLYESAYDSNGNIIGYVLDDFLVYEDYLGVIHYIPYVKFYDENYGTAEYYCTIGIEPEE